MSRRATLATVFFGMCAVLAGCSVVGTGGASRAVAYGPATSAAIVSALNGGLVGTAFGSGLNESDREVALQAEYRALEHTQAGKAVDWNGTGVEGSVTAGQPYRVGSQDCRQYTQTISSGGQNRSARGTACRNPDGSWTLLS